jgi:hypothetical protein
LTIVACAGTGLPPSAKSEFTIALPCIARYMRIFTAMCLPHHGLHSTVTATPVHDPPCHWRCIENLGTMNE